MSTVFTANSSSITVNGDPVPGVRAIDYRRVREQGDVFALGSEERIAVYYGATRVQGRVTIASASPPMDTLSGSGDQFQLVAQLRHGDTARSVSFDECYMETKEYNMGTGGAGETVYVFSATRVREEDEGGAE